RLQITKDRVDRALADGTAADVDARDASLGGERHDLGVCRVEVGLRQAELPFGERYDRTSLRGLVGKAGGERSCAEVLGPDSADWQKFGRHPVAEGDRAGFVEQQRIDVARRLDGAPRGGDDVEADQP